ncbi:MAG TPA: type I-C CRISPR-associated endonuclease Cas1c [Thermoanaerobaculia bacterium]|nr:type I-C CRISPR-associated endonuclease Cas1c [Thermoanaerobaculia bacterium]
MKHHLNTLYVVSQGAYIAKESETVVVRVDGAARLQLPILAVGSIVCFGRVSCSPALMHFCGERGVAISFLSEHGRFLAKVVGPVHGNVLLRREQYRRADDDSGSRAIAIPIIAAKVMNGRTSILRALRDRPEASGAEALERACGTLSALVGGLAGCESLDAARGIEGASAREYFAALDHMIVQQKEDFFFRERTRRPPLDRFNALLSFVYTLVMHDVVAALECVGLDPAVGFLHRDRPGRPGLALDLMEELRTWLADRLVLSLINLRQISADDFQTLENAAVVMHDEGRKRLLAAYQKRKQEELLHPFLEEKVTIGLIPHIQAQLLARHLRGDLDAYPPFLWK